MRRSWSNATRARGFRARDRRDACLHEGPTPVSYTHLDVYKRQIGDSRLAYRLVVDTMNEDYWRDFGRRRDTLVAPSLAWYGQDTQIVASYEHRDYLYPFDRGTALDPTTGKPLDIPSRRRLDEPYNNMWGSTELAQVTVDQRVTDNWKAHLGYSWNCLLYTSRRYR